MEPEGPTYYSQAYKWTFKETYFCSRAGGRLLYGPHPARPGCGMGEETGT